ncbi:hypothetical protein CLTEP_06050 [Clostridium tepidiprofundi DSM 19306]|uniref:Uncharacterized protein n=1 Tax=Clostridium tepidiprofundi DSM 19306 TaxID=1121338 RepID=A0A151B6B0_9CLOT|nr:hypothetical protein [Clostridium tepidiprofundi]KYH35429.1 hypothetical protein CLTEP_06050 [Clostridium tepidiprofundi DSM 19306]
MSDKECGKNGVRKFSDIVAISSEKNINYLVYNARFTSAFSYRIKKLIAEIRDVKKDIDFIAMFNTEGDIAIIDTKIIADFIADNYVVMIEKYYRSEKAFNIIKKVRRSNKKVRLDFTNVSYNILYKTFDEIYREIYYDKKIVNKMKIKYGIMEYSNKDLIVVLLSLTILEDICKQVDIDRYNMVKYVKEVIIRT